MESCRFELDALLGLVSSPNVNVCVANLPDDEHNNGNKNITSYALTGVGEAVRVWNLRLGSLSQTLHDPANESNAEVTIISGSPSDPFTWAVGYHDGSVRVWRLASEQAMQSGRVHGATLQLTFNGHRSGISVLAWDATGTRLFSGGRDTDIVLWDLHAEVGVCRLRGHSNQITGLHYLPQSSHLASGNGSAIASGWLLSTSKDSLLKCWDLSTEHCVETIVEHPGEITCMQVIPFQSDLSTAEKGEEDAISAIIFTAGTDRTVRCFAFREGAANALLTMHDDPVSGTVSGGKVLSLLSSTDRQGSDRAISMVTISAHTSKYLIILGGERTIELWKIRSVHGGTASGSVLKQMRFTRLQARVRSIYPMRVEECDRTLEPTAKQTARKSAKCIRLLLGTADNLVGEMRLPMDPLSEYDMQLDVLAALGHRDEVTQVTWSLRSPDQTMNRTADGLLFATGSKDGSVRVWSLEGGSRSTLCPFRALNLPPGSGGVHSITFLPGNRMLLVGDGVGRIHVADLVAASASATDAMGDFMESFQAHEGGGALRCMVLRPDGKGMITGGGPDKILKFWDFKTGALSGGSSGKKTAPSSPSFRVKMVRSLQLTEEVVAVRWSPDLRYVAVASMDMTVKVFFQEDLRFYLSLYGHKLPITAMDISPDGRTLISASADKTVKIWSLEFGDCRKSIFAHQDVITGIAFLPAVGQDSFTAAFGRKDATVSTPSTQPNFITCSKDGGIKYWDGAHYGQVLQRLPPSHHGEIWNMAVTIGNESGSFNQGEHSPPLTPHYLVSVGRDRSIRVWSSESGQSLWPDEEGLEEREANLEASLLEENPFEEGDTEAVEGERRHAATVKTVLSLRAGERIVDAIEVADSERQKWDEWEAEKAVTGGKSASSMPTPAPIFLIFGRDKSPAEYVLAAIERIPLPDLEDALLCLPTGSLSSLLLYIRDWFRLGRHGLFASRVLEIVLRLFHACIMRTPRLHGLLQEMREMERQFLYQFKDMLEFNAQCIKMMLHLD